MANLRVPKDRIQRFAEEYGLPFNEASDQYHAVVKDLAKHPQVPTDEQCQEIEFSQQPFIYDSACDPSPGLNFKPWNREKHFIREWQRRCFVQEELDESPEEICKKVFDTFAEEFFATRGKVSENAMDCLFKAMTIHSNLRKGEQK